MTNKHLGTIFVETPKVGWQMVHSKTGEVGFSWIMEDILYGRDWIRYPMVVMKEQPKEIPPPKEDKLIGEKMITEQPEFVEDVTKVLEELREMLIAKNRKYGDAALNPTRVFSRSSPVELINVRLDDKLSRILSRQSDEDEDPEWDIMGYLVLKRIAQNRAKAGS